MTIPDAGTTPVLSTVVDSLSRRRLLVSLGAAGALGIAGCGAPENGRPRLVEGPETTTTFPEFGQTLRSPVESEPITPSAVGTADASIDRSIVATAQVSEIEVYDAPDGQITHRMANPTPADGPLVFLTTSNEADWHEVLLPVRPNGSIGWVRDQDVSLAAHNYRIRVDLADFRLRVTEGGVPIFDTVAGVASDNSPTPGGRYYLTELRAPTTPDTVYGSFAYGLSGFSETFETFNGGPGQLGIHGTNSPESLGTAVSAGCIRLHNDDVARLVTFLPLGVPVVVV
ncbi:MAG: lipoprotein-anchoring transpeptidase ErfK/SrfK [Verrucomicrobiales bacterium]